MAAPISNGLSPLFSHTALIERNKASAIFCSSWVAQFGMSSAKCKARRRTLVTMGGSQLRSPMETSLSTQSISLLLVKPYPTQRRAYRRLHNHTDLVEQIVAGGHQFMYYQPRTCVGRPAPRSR